MNTKDFFYDLPEELIAQHGVTPRDHSRMLCMDRETGELSHKHFYDIIDYLHQGDLLVMNNSRVIPARIYGIKKDTGANMEILLLEEKEKDVWEILVKPGKKAKPGAILSFGDGKLECQVLEVMEDGNRIVKFSYNGDFYTILDEIGSMPLPPYITEKLSDKERYQTVYSKELGSSAAPTAGLHFTPELMEKIKAKGVKIAYVTLHVGLGTFRPVKASKIEDHKMHTEHYHLPKETAEEILKTKEAGGRVIAVGTTSCRTLEGAFLKEQKICEASGDTNIFIYPGKSFNVIDGLITNFHLPESTLIMLVSAFAGYENTMNAYKIAVDEKYRFFSFGDSMCILPNMKG